MTRTELVGSSGSISSPACHSPFCRPLSWRWPLGPILRLSGSYYGEHPEPLILLALAGIPSAANNVLSGAALSVGATRLWLLSDVALAACLLGAAAWLVNAHGAGGLAFSYLAAYMATDLVLALGLRGRLGNVKVDATASLERTEPVA